MTTVRPLSHVPHLRGLAAGSVMLLASLGAIGPGASHSAAEPPRHWLHAGAMPPGAIGSQRLLRGGPLLGYTQPVELQLPSGATVAATGSAGQPVTGWSERLKVGLQIGTVYRFEAQVQAGQDLATVYPTVELIDRTYPPAGRENDFPIPVELTAEDLRLAAEGAFVTRVVYVEDPRTALPVSERELGGQQWFEVRPGDDPLVVADGLGRPVAIVRIGNRSTGKLAKGAYGDPVPLARKPVVTPVRQASMHSPSN